MEKKIFISIYLIIHCIFLNGQVNALDFANLSKYGIDNKYVKNPKVVFIGNSITEGWVNVMPDFFTKNNFVGRGISGQTSAQLLLRFRDDVINLKPKMVVINIGINDIAENTGPYSEDFTVSHIESMIMLAQASKIKVIVASVLPAKSFVWRKSIQDVPAKVLSLNNRLKKLASKYKTKYLDYHSELKDRENGLSPDMAEDGVHPTLKCYQIMAVLALRAVGKG
jgi:lysophospholipase L1-like esterase